MHRLALILVALAIAVPGCKRISSDKLEAAIAKKLADMYKVTVDSVKCPQDISPKKGDIFRCKASFDGISVDFEVHQNDGDGNVRYQQVQPTLVRHHVEQQMIAWATKQLQGKASNVTANCENLKTQIAVKGSSFTCTLAATGEKATPFIVEVTDDDGSIEWKPMGSAQPTAPIAK